MEAEVERLLAAGIVRPSKSAWSSPAMVVRTPGRDPRMVVDYSELNSKLQSNAFPMRNQLDILEHMREYKFFGKLDLRSSYHQIALDKKSWSLTAFATPKGLYEFNQDAIWYQDCSTVFPVLAVVSVEVDS
jgi:hypothetical protein